jgi:ATP-binding cassette subfamily F protein uup
MGTPASKRTPAPAPKKTEKKRKLSFKEQNELAALPDQIDALEQERDRLYGALGDPVFLRDGAGVAAAKERLLTIESEITAMTERWEALETIAADV